MRRWLWLGLIGALVLPAAGGFAAESTEYVAHRGPQPPRILSQHPTIDRRFLLPLYIGWPDRPFEVLGYVLVYGDEQGTEETRLEAVRSAVVAARGRHAEALMMVPVRELPPRPDGARPLFAYAYALKWIDQ